jgi:hypothetical protein
LSEPRFDELLRRLAAADAEFVVIGGLAVSAWGVCSLDDLKEMKKAAGRTRDLADLEDLEASAP